MDSKAECGQLNLAHVARKKINITRSQAVARIADQYCLTIDSISDYC